MPTKKKQLQEYQVEKILQKRNIILFYQYSNAKVEEWDILKKSLLDAFSINTLEMVDAHLLSDFSKTFATLIIKNCLGYRCVTSARLKALSITGSACKTFSDELVEEKGWGNFFQGPTLLFACDSHHQMIAGYNAINRSGSQHSSISLIGGIYYGKTMTHLDLTKMCKLDQRAHASLTSSLTENVRLLLNQRLCFYQSRLLLYLDYHAAGLCHIKEKSSISPN